MIIMSYQHIQYIPILLTLNTYIYYIYYIRTLESVNCIRPYHPPQTWGPRHLSTMVGQLQNVTLAETPQNFAHKGKLKSSIVRNLLPLSLSLSPSFKVL